MLRKLFVLFAVGLLVLPAVASAQFQQGDWELKLSGSGGSDKDFDSTSLGVSGSIGYFVTKELEVGLRQGLSWFDSEFDDAWAGSTAVFAEYHFDLGAWQPFVGVGLGYAYGDDVDDFWAVAPEAGVKYFVNATTFIFAQIEYQISLDDSDDSQFAYSLGIGFRF